MALPTKKELKKVLSETNLHSAPGTDGLTFFLYNECWDIIGDSLLEVVVEIFKGSQPTTSQRTSLMVFGSKLKNLGLSSLKTREKYPY